ncbi:MAG TPA: SDR family oxidoreductase [Euzebyales bacterium]|nr:SDR family oxidoreductase [Euzebyales bacterium]
MPEWRRALVTGASSGIGEAFARRLAAEGTDLVLVARGRDGLERVADHLRARHGVAVEVLATDLATPDGCAPAVDRLRDSDAVVDLLVNNAGIGTSGLFGEVDLDRELALIDLNITALVRLTHAAVGGMRARGHGGVINVSSLSSLQPYPNGANYGASKAYVTSFSKAIHTELEPSGVRVLALCPGFTRTSYHDAAGIRRTPIPDRLWLRPDEVAAEGLAALRAGRSVRVVGVAYRAWAGLTKVVPDVLIRRLLARAGGNRT